GPDADTFGCDRNLEQGGESRLVPEVVVGGHDVETAVLCELRPHGVRARPLVGLEASPTSRGDPVTSGRYVGIRRRPIRSTRMITRSSGSGQAKRMSWSRQSSSDSARCFAARERQDRLEGVDTEMPTVGDAQTARLGELEAVAHLEAADGAPLDPLHGHPEVVELCDALAQPSNVSPAA